MTNIFKWPGMAEVITYSLSRTCLTWLFSKLGLKLDLVLGSPSGNRPQLTTQSLLSVEPVLVERYFLFQASIWLFAQHHVYLQMFQLCELPANDFDEFWLTAVQCLRFESFFFEFCKFFPLAMFTGTLCAISTKIHLQYVELFCSAFDCTNQLMKSIQGW